MAKNYILNTHEGFSFNVDFNQSFYNKWNYFSNYRELLKSRSENRITDDDMIIIKFLFRFTFATIDMIARLLKKEDIQEVEKQLDHLVNSKALNSFILALGHDNTFPPDALKIYCLDLGGRTLLSHFSNEDTTNWDTTLNMKSPEKITNDLVVGDFYIKLKETCPGRIVYFKQNPEFRIGRTAIIPSFEMGIEVNKFLTEYYVGQVVRDYDYPMNFRSKLERLNSVFTTNAWKKYYHDTLTPPTILFLGESDLSIAKMASMIDGTSEIKDFRLTTDERLKKELSSAFLELGKKDGKTVLKVSPMIHFSKDQEDKDERDD